MLIVTTDTIPGKELEMLGIVKGSTIQTVNALRDIGAGRKTIIGGELKKYNEMMDNARRTATDRMVDVERGVVGAGGVDAWYGVVEHVGGAGVRLRCRLAQVVDHALDPQCVRGLVPQPPLIRSPLGRVGLYCLFPYAELSLVFGGALLLLAAHLSRSLRVYPREAAR